MINHRRAQTLHSWLQNELRNSGRESRRFLATEMKSAYAQIFEEQAFICRPWPPLAAFFSWLIGKPGIPRKAYTDLVGRDGRKRRLRVYEIPEARR